MSAHVLDFPVPISPTEAVPTRLRLVPPPPPEPTFRLTRRGRVVLALLAAAVLLVVALAAGQLAAASGEPRTVTVRAGQTLSEIADRELPELSLSDGIVAIQVANSLSTDQVHAGQRLVIPDH